MPRVKWVQEKAPTKTLDERLSEVLTDDLHAAVLLQLKLRDASPELRRRLMLVAYGAPLNESSKSADTAKMAVGVGMVKQHLSAAGDPAHTLDSLLHDLKTFVDPVFGEREPDEDDVQKLGEGRRNGALFFAWLLYRWGALGTRMKRLNPARKLQVVIPKGDPVYRACSESGMASRQSGKRRPKP